MRFKVEIEARRASYNLWIPSTLVFSFLKTRFRVFVIYEVVKERFGIWSTPDPFPSRWKRMRQFSIRWSVRGSNPRPPACKAGALPAELTPQNLLGLPVTPPDTVGLERFELSTPRLSSVCSNQLSYRPRLVICRTTTEAQEPLSSVGPSKLNSKIEKNP